MSGGSITGELLDAVIRRERGRHMEHEMNECNTRLQQRRKTAVASISVSRVNKSNAPVAYDGKRGFRKLKDMNSLYNVRLQEVSALPFQYLAVELAMCS